MTPQDKCKVIRGYERAHARMRKLREPLSDAALIADLLSMCQQYLSDIESYRCTATPERYDALKSVIAKATKKA